MAAIQELSSLLGSKISIAQIDMGMLNRIIVHDLLLYDHNDKEMLKVARLSTKFEILPLFRGKINISNIQLFGFDVNLYRTSHTDVPNYKFLLDALVSSDTLKTHRSLDLRINSVLVRRGRINYDVLSSPSSIGVFSTDHIHLQGILANLSIKALQTDSVNASIKRMSFEEAHSGFVLKKLNLKVTANQQQMEISNFNIGLAHTVFSMDTIRLTYPTTTSIVHLDSSVQCSFHLLPSRLTLSDFSPFIPQLNNFNDALDVELNANGNFNQLNCPLLSLTSPDYHFALRGGFTLQDLSYGQDAFVYGKLSRFSLDSSGTDFIVRNLSPQLPATVSIMLKRLGKLSFAGEVSGYINELVTYGKLRTDIGTVLTDIKLNSNKDIGSFTYTGSVKASEFEVGKLIENKSLGKTTFDLLIDSRHYPKHYPFISLKGAISSLNYNGYQYNNITLDGKYQSGGFAGLLLLDDPNGFLRAEGNINWNGQLPMLNIDAEISRLNLNNLQLTKIHPDATLSLKCKANITGRNIDDMKGQINIDSLIYDSPLKYYTLDHLDVQALRLTEHDKLFSIHSNFLHGEIRGDYSYRTLPASLYNILHAYIPSLMPSAENTNHQSANNFSFDVSMSNAEFFATLFKVPLTLYTRANLKGRVDDCTNSLRVEGYFPRLRYKDYFIESGMLRCDNTNDKLHALIRLNQRKENESINLAAEAKAEQDSIFATFNWGNSGTATYSGQLAVNTLFNKVSSDVAPTVTFKLLPTQVILNDTVWNIHPSTVKVDSGRVHISHFNFSHLDRHLVVNGILSKLNTDTVRINLNKINIGYVFDLARLGVNFQGEASGSAIACGILDEPAIQTNLSIRDFGLNNALLGDARIRGEWHHAEKGIYLDADIQEVEKARTHVYGYIYPTKPTSGLDLNIEAHNTNLKFIHHYMNNITSDFSGRATGNIHFYGKFKELTLNGTALMNASLKVDVLGTSYTIRDSLFVRPEGLYFRSNRVSDSQGNEGILSGFLRYDHFRNPTYQFDLTSQGMLMLNTNESPDYPFYGQVYGTGNASIAGDSRRGVNIDVAMTTNRNSYFTFIKDNVTTAMNNQFVKFVDRTPHRIIPDSTFLSDYEQARREVTDEANEMADIRLNLIVDATPDVQMKIIMDPMAGDYMSGRGTGNIRTEFYNKGDVRMFGNYRINQGNYKFSIQDVIRKDFVIGEGSNLIFNGIPQNANMDIKATYTVNSVSLTDLLPATASTGDYITQNNVKVNCLMNLSGSLTSPEIKLGIELPGERDEVQALVRNYIPTDEQMNMQILYLLSIGKFYTPENSTNKGQNSDVMSSVLSSTLSGQLNSALSSIINNNDWNVGTNLSTGERGWTDVEFEGVLSGQMLNNRLIINGNFAYRENPLSNTNFVGDFEAEWLVNRSGDIRLKAYNETNDRYYTRTNLTTQGIGILFKKDFNRWKELMFWERWKLNRLKKIFERRNTRNFKNETTTSKTETKADADLKTEKEMLPPAAALKRADL